MKLIDEKELKGVGDFLYYRDVEQSIECYLNGTKKMIEAETTHFGNYDDHWKWLKGEITGFGGIPNHGKSKFVIFLTALKMFYANWKIAMYSPETTPPEFFFSNYIHTFTGYNVFSKTRKPTTGEVREVSSLLHKNLFLCEPERLPTFKGILERFQRAFEYHGCDAFIIDPFNCLDREWEHSQRDDRYVGDFLEHFKDFAKQTKTSGVIVMHPNSSIKKEKDGFNYECPNTYNLAGGAMWANKLDNLIFVHRPFFTSDKSNSEVLIRHSKIKKREIVGAGGDATVDFNFMTNRYGLAGYFPEFGKAAPKENLIFENTDVPF